MSKNTITSKLIPTRKRWSALTISITPLFLFASPNLTSADNHTWEKLSTQKKTLFFYATKKQLHPLEFLTEITETLLTVLTYYRY